MKELIASSKPLSCITPAAGAAGTSAITGSTIDTDGFRSVLFLLHLGPIVTAAVTSFKIQHGDAADASDMADVQGSSQTVADDADNTIFYSDFYRVTKRYARIVVSRGTQNATIGSAVALLYNAAESGATQVAAGETIAAAISGTA